MPGLRWLGTRDRDLAALRRAGRTAVVMPAMFAIGDKVIGNSTIATYAAFGSFALLLLVDFGGPVRLRLQNQIALSVVGATFVCIGTLASRATWLAAVAMAIAGFAVLFSGTVSSALTSATTSLLLAFILPVTLRAPVSSIPDRLAGWAMAAAASFIAVTVLWPAPSHYPLRTPVVDACRALAASARTIVRLVDEINWLDAVVAGAAPHPPGIPVNAAACKVKLAAASVLELGAGLLDDKSASPDGLRDALAELHRSLAEVEQNATAELPVGPVPPGNGPGSDKRITLLVSSLDPSFRSQELSFAVSQIAANIDLAAAAERRSWLERVTGRQPGGITSTFSAAQERAASHVDWHSVTLHNSLRGAFALGLAVLVAGLTGVQHSFWVVLGTLSVLRSNALSTGQNVVRGLLGTVAGFVAGAAVLALIGTNSVLLWLLLPVSVLLAGVAPAAVSFAAGQAAFTVVLVILFNIVQPLGWRVGLLRVEDVAIGCAVSLVVGLLFWPRGAAAALRRALAEAYRDSARYLAAAVEFGMGRCDASLPAVPAPTEAAARSAAAARRLDDTFRGYLAERGAKPVPLADVTGLVTGVVALRLGGDAVLDLWRRDDGESDDGGDRAAARHELLANTERVAGWYEALASSLVDDSEVPAPLARDAAADQRLVDAVRHDLSGGDGRASATAVRMIWTGDHLDAARRLQGLLAERALEAAKQSALATSFR